MQLKVQVLVMTFLLGCSLTPLVDAECLVPEKLDTDPPFPNVLGLARSYKFSLEVNCGSRNKSMYVTEYYDSGTSSGRLDVEDEGDLTQVLYLQGTDELFFLKNGVVCESSRLSEQSEESFNARFGVWNWAHVDVEQPILGPSNLFRKAFRDWTNGKMGFQNGSAEVRGMQSKVWTSCYGDQNSSIESSFYFVDAVLERPVGFQDLPYPARIVSKGTWNGVEVTQNFEIVGVQLDIPHKMKTFAIPVQTGCKRQVDLGKVPSYEGKDLYLEAEVIFRPPSSFGNFTYVSDIAMALDSGSQHVAFEMTPWTTSENGESSPGDSLRKVYDLKRGYVYDVDRTMDTCSVTMSSLDKPDIVFPDGQRMSLLDPDFFITNQPLEDYHYLGEVVERAISASIFEKTLESPDTISQRIVTRYHLSEGVTLLHENREEKAPLRIVYLNDVNLDDPKEFAGRVDINIYDFSSRLSKKSQRFDVTPCFPETGDSEWVEIVFPMNGTSLRDVMPLIPHMEENLLTLLSPDVELSPLRISRVKVDADPDNLYVTALLLERPPYMLDFTEVKKASIKAEKNSKLSGLSSREDCAKLCVDRGDCTYFSYCGAVCTVQANSEDPVLEDNQDCKLFRLDGNRADAIPSLEEVSNNIDYIVQRPPGLRLFLDSMELKASKFRAGIVFGKDARPVKPEGNLLEERFQTYRVGQKFDVTAANEAGSNLGPLSLSRCTRTCLSSATCQSLSYCMDSSQCYLSTSHGDDIPPEHLSDDNQCGVFTRSFSDYFEEYPGILMSGKAAQQMNVPDFEACAKACKTTSTMDCRSFDTCYSEGVMTCLLHRTHFLEVTDPTDWKSDSSCGHYSRKPSLDFTQFWHKELTGSEGVTLTEVGVERCAKVCADSATCKGFNHCSDYADSSTSCVLKTDFLSSKNKDSLSCTAFLKK